MSRNEEPYETIQRLLKRYVRVVKDDQSLAAIHVGPEWQDHEILKEYDGQVTVGTEGNDERKLSFDGDLRQRLSIVRVSVWSIDKPEQKVQGRIMRDRVNSEIRRVIREKRLHPNETQSDFVGIGVASQSHKAWHAALNSEPSPTNSAWIELDEEQYQKLWYSDDNRFQHTAQESGAYAFLLLKFRLDADPEVLKAVKLEFEGHGLAPAGNGLELKIWNSASGLWEHSVSGSGSNDESLTIELSSDLADFVDDERCVFCLARTINPGDGVDPAVLYCDYAQAIITTNGLTYADLASFRDVDLVNVKPFVWHTEFVVKTWFFENVPVIREE